MGRATRHPPHRFLVLLALFSRLYPLTWTRLAAGARGATGAVRLAVASDAGRAPLKETADMARLIGMGDEKQTNSSLDQAKKKEKGYVFSSFFSPFFLSKLFFSLSLPVPPSPSSSSSPQIKKTQFFLLFFVGIGLQAV